MVATLAPSKSTKSQTRSDCNLDLAAFRYERRDNGRVPFCARVRCVGVWHRSADLYAGGAVAARQRGAYIRDSPRIAACLSLPSGHGASAGFKRR